MPIHLNYSYRKARKNKMTNCETCGAQIAEKASYCPFCGAKKKNPVYKRAWLWILALIAIGNIAANISGNGNNNNGGNNDNGNGVVSNSDTSNNSEAKSSGNSKNSAFEGDPGIKVSANLSKSSIDYPELNISITNTTQKDILAVKLYVVYFDVYGEEVKVFSKDQELFTDETIAAGKSGNISVEHILEKNIKKANLYVYSVYFADGTQWGDKDALKSAILNNGKLIEVSGSSR